MIKSHYTGERKESDMSSAKRLQELMDYLGVNATEFGKMTGIPKSSISMYLSGQRIMKSDRIGIISEKFGIDPAWLMDRDVPMRQSVKESDVIEVPIYGKVAAGNGVCAYEDVSGYVTVSRKLASTGDIFALRITGDSMQPRIADGDVVIVRKQSDADNGDTVIALVNGDDAICKRLRKYDGGIMLLSNNPKYEPRVFTKQDTDDIPVRIIGRVMELRSEF